MRYDINIIQFDTDSGVKGDLQTAEIYGLRRKKLTGEADETSFVSVLVMSGAGKVTAGDETLEVKKGDSIFITAGSGEYELEGDMEALLTTV